jgi:hypothetical protein
MSRPEILRRVRSVREELLATNEKFTRQQEFQAVLERCADLSDSALEGLVAWGCDTVDKESTQPNNPTETPSFPGFTMDGAVKLGRGERIAKKAMRIEHAITHLCLLRKNKEDVDRKLAVEENAVETLRPWWGPGVKLEEAYESYTRSQGGAA